MRGHLHQCGPCPYLPGRDMAVFKPDPAEVRQVPYRALMDLRFRRAGPELYTPLCEGCRECRPLRVDVARFVPRHDQQRCLRRNQDLELSFAPRGLDGGRLELYRRYQAQVHEQPDQGDPQPFLVEDGGIPGGELHARDPAGTLLAVSVVDVFGDALSSVYCYWEPAQARRALGTFMALAELAWARSQGMQWWYPGFWVPGCAKMAYKARFGPHQVLDEGVWRDG